ncbi:TrmB family transcriptional regulator [Halospeciosus flavus]|uniref:TrmB family transcriptional regulator n=1 Tax=Halospeciosus flavus TaxID=3032283 RepID=UPI00360951E9
MSELNTQGAFGHSGLRETLTENVGMSSSEADVYLALVQYGKQSMTEIADHSGVPKQRVYDVVDGLRSDGFVEIVDEYPKKAYAVDPAETIEPLIDRLHRAEDELESLYERVEEIEGGISLFKSRASIEKHVREVLDEAEESVYLTIPFSELDTFATDIRAVRERGARVLLVISNLPEAQIGEDAVTIDEQYLDVADRIRGIKSNEEFLLTADRRSAIFWTDVDETRMTSDQQGYRITNPELAFTLDRFLDESIWPLTKPVANRDTDPTYPERYLRMRNCLIDLREATETHPLRSFRVEFEGHDVESREEVTKRGTLVGYHYSPFDRRAYMQLDVNGEGVVTVGGWKATLEDYEARRITIELHEDRRVGNQMDDETARHLESCRTALPETLDGVTIEPVFGFDGFVDRVREMVDTRQGSDSYDQLDELQTFGDRLSRSAASDTSFTNEWIQTDLRCGGHTSHLSRAFGRFDYAPTLVGAFGKPIEDVFLEEFGEYDVFSYGAPTITDAVEFNDGKLMLQETGDLPSLDWATLRGEIGLEMLADAVDGSTVLGIGYWASAPSMPTVWDGIREELWPLLDDPPDRIFVDPADVRQLSTDLLAEGAPALERLDDCAPVTVSANRGETGVFADLGSSTGDERPLVDTVEDARDALGVTRFVGHSPTESAVCGPDGTFRSVVPRVDDPELTTSAGTTSTPDSSSHSTSISATARRSSWATRSRATSSVTVSHRRTTSFGPSSRSTKPSSTNDNGTDFTQRRHEDVRRR